MTRFVVRYFRQYGRLHSKVRDTEFVACCRAVSARIIVGTLLTAGDIDLTQVIKAKSRTDSNSSLKKKRVTLATVCNGYPAEEKVSTRKQPREDWKTHTTAETTSETICRVVMMIVKMIGPNFLIV